MILHNLAPDAVAAMTRADLWRLDREPESPIPEFEFHGCTVGVGAFTGSPPWERHNGGDELLYVLSGSCALTIIEGTRQITPLQQGSLAIVPTGTWHRNEAPDGVTMIYITPIEGNQHSFDEPRD